MQKEQRWEDRMPECEELGSRSEDFSFAWGMQVGGGEIYERGGATSVRTESCLEGPRIFD